MSMPETTLPPPEIGVMPNAAGATPGRSFATRLVLTAVGLYGVILALNILQYPGTSERAWKTRRIDEQARAGRPFDVFVLGSSRVMQISPAYLQAITGGRAFNYGSSAAGPIDFYAQVHYLAERGNPIKTLVIGVDERAFSCVPINRYVQTNAGHWGLFTRLPFPENLCVLGDIVSNSTLTSTGVSIGQLAKPPAPRNRDIRRASEILLDDGYMIYKDRLQAKAAGRYDLGAMVRAKASDFISGDERLRQQAVRVSPRCLELFGQTLDLARARGADVRVMLLPMHPAMEAMVGDESFQRFRDELARQLRALCEARRCVFADFRAMGSYGGEANEFWDGVHQTRENTRRMINVLFSLPPGKMVATVPTDDELLKHLPAVTTLTTY